MLRIEQRMKAYEQVLRGVQGLFAVKGDVDRTEFRAYYRSLALEHTYPGIQGVGFSLLMRPEEKDRHISSVRRETGLDYSIRPDGKRSEYSTIVFLEPFSDRNLRAFGYDMYSEPVRHAAMEQAAISGSPKISGRVTLVQETEHQTQSGFLMFLPVYKTTNPPPAERRSALLGWVYAPFRMNDLMSGVIGAREFETDLEIYDGDPADSSSLMYDSDPRNLRDFKAFFQNKETITLDGRTWTVMVRSTPAFELEFDTHKPHVAAVVGIGSGILFALLTMLLVNSRARAMDKLKVEERYKNLMQQASDGILVVNTERLIIDANEHACVHFGYTIDELRGMRIDDLHPPEAQVQVVGEFEMLKTKKSARFEILNKRKDGSLVPVEISERIVDVEGEEYILKFVRDISERKHAEHEREKLVSELQAALADVKTLSGLIPICSSCKKIRDDKGYWNVLEQYLIEHSEAQFTHGVCPDCMRKLYPEYMNKRDAEIGGG
ncbi:MAG TPA: CHASE domain-containing protein [Bacteroidota bacterium]|nr:CHASE domain-containing protein [Bacteroidota bacterium]